MITLVLQYLVSSGLLFFVSRVAFNSTPKTFQLGNSANLSVAETQTLKSKIFNVPIVITFPKGWTSVEIAESICQVETIKKFTVYTNKTCIDLVIESVLLEFKSASTINETLIDRDASIVKTNLEINGVNYEFTFDFDTYSVEDVANTFCEKKAGEWNINEEELEERCTRPISSALSNTLDQSSGITTDPKDSPTATEAVHDESVYTDATIEVEPESQTTTTTPEEDETQEESSTDSNVKTLTLSVNGREYVVQYDPANMSTLDVGKQFCLQEAGNLGFTIPSDEDTAEVGEDGGMSSLEFKDCVFKIVAALDAQSQPVTPLI